MKSGTFSEDNNVITWTATLNALYQKVVKVTDNFGEGVKAGTLKNLKVTSVAFGRNGAKKN
ncbi:hypothetical protein GQR36_14640 [Enterococcus termitis]